MSLVIGPQSHHSQEGGVKGGRGWGGQGWALCHIHTRWRLWACFGNSPEWKVVLSQQLLGCNYTVYCDGTVQSPTFTSLNVCMPLLIVALLRHLCDNKCVSVTPFHNDVTLKMSRL